MAKKNTDSTKTKAVGKKPAAKSAASKPKAKRRETPEQLAKRKEKERKTVEARIAEQKKLFLSVFEKKGGNPTSSCIAAGIGRSTYYAWLESDKEFAEAVHNVKESLIDMAESKLLESIQGGNLTATIFYLKTQGKDRGYVERTEQDVNMNEFMDAMRGLPDPPEEV